MPFAAAFAWITEYRVAGCERQTVRPMRPSSPLGRPLVSCVHVLPASRVFQIPLSGPAGRNPYSRRSRSSEAAYKTSGFDGSIAMSVKPVYLLISLVFVHVLPPSV